MIRLDLPEPPAINRLLRLHHRERSRIRDDLVLRCLAQRPRGWKALERWRLDAHLRLWNLRDPLELAAGLKLHVDALHLAGLVVDDSPEHMALGEVRQEINRKNRGVTLTIRADET